MTRKQAKLNIRKLPEKERAEFFAFYHFLVFVRQVLGMRIKFL